MSQINLPPGQWQVIALRSVVLQRDTRSEPAPVPLRFGEETALPLVVQDLAGGAVYRLGDGQAPDAANLVAGGAAAVALPAITVEQALRAASAADNACARERSERLLPVAREAQELLLWAATNGRTVDAEVRNTLVAMTDVLGRDAAGVEDEQKLLKAYEALTTKLAPVSAATLKASMQRLPHISTLFQFNKGNFLAGLSGMTFGRFAHALFFVLVLVVAALALGYHAIGNSALGRYEKLSSQLDTLATEAVKQQAVVRDKEAIHEQAKARNDAQAVRLAANDLQQATDTLALTRLRIEQVAGERSALPARIDGWVPGSHPTGEQPSVAEVIDSGRTVLEHLNRIVLPLLFGLLGSYSYILRSISIDIRAQQFAPNSSLHHIARLSLGALAGIAATWLLTPGSFGLAETLPMWTLAFVAGYGTELIFAFMDRIVSALKS